MGFKIKSESEFHQKIQELKQFDSKKVLTKDLTYKKKDGRVFTWLKIFLSFLPGDRFSKTRIYNVSKAIEDFYVVHQKWFSPEEKSELKSVLDYLEIETNKSKNLKRKDRNLQAINHARKVIGSTLNLETKPNLETKNPEGSKKPSIPQEEKTQVIPKGNPPAGPEEKPSQAPKNPPQIPSKLHQTPNENPPITPKKPTLAPKGKPPVPPKKEPAPTKDNVTVEEEIKNQKNNTKPNQDLDQEIKPEVSQPKDEKPTELPKEEETVVTELTPDKKEELHTILDKYRRSSDSAEFLSFIDQNKYLELVQEVKSSGDLAAYYYFVRNIIRSETDVFNRVSIFINSEKQIDPKEFIDELKKKHDSTVYLNSYSEVRVILFAVKILEITKSSDSDKGKAEKIAILLNDLDVWAGSKNEKTSIGVTLAGQCNIRDIPHIMDGFIEHKGTRQRFGEGFILTILGNADLEAMRVCLSKYWPNREDYVTQEPSLLMKMLPTFDTVEKLEIAVQTYKAAKGTDKDFFLKGIRCMQGFFKVPLEQSEILSVLDKYYT